MPAPALLPAPNDDSGSDNDDGNHNDLPPSRSASASSSLDPYYFGFQSPEYSPLPHPASTPDQLPINEPITPARNPATIDRRGLVGVGELATPRWTRTEHAIDPDDSDSFPPLGVIPPLPDDEPDSPAWTIEAVDGETDEKDEARFSPLSISLSTLFSSLYRYPSSLRRQNFSEIVPQSPRRAVARRSFIHAIMAVPPLPEHIGCLVSSTLSQTTLQTSRVPRTALSTSTRFLPPHLPAPSPPDVEPKSAPRTNSRWTNMEPLFPKPQVLVLLSSTSPKMKNHPPPPLANIAASTSARHQRLPPEMARLGTAVVRASVSQ